MSSASSVRMAALAITTATVAVTSTIAAAPAYASTPYQRSTQALGNRVGIKWYPNGDKWRIWRT